MKLLYITNARIPTERAHGLQIVKMCEAYSKLGHDVTLVLPKRITKIKKNLFTYYDVDKVFDVEYVNSFDFIRYAFLLKRFAYYFQTFVFLWKTATYSINSIVITRTPSIAWWHKKKGRYSVCEVHNWPTSKMGQFAVIFFLRNIDSIICNSEGTQKEFLDRGIPAEVAHNAVDVEKFNIDVDIVAAKKALNIPLDKKIIMYIGSLEKWKGVQTLLEASELFHEKIQVVIVGGDNLQVEKKSTLFPKVLFLGNRPYSELPKIQKTADILVVPNSSISIESVKYTSPIKIFAHMISKVPMVVSRLPSIECVLDESEALFFEPDNSTDLFQTIMRALHDPSWSKHIVDNAYKKGLLFTWMGRADKILNIISSNK